MVRVSNTDNAAQLNPTNLEFFLNATEKTFTLGPAASTPEINVTFNLDRAPLGYKTLIRIDENGEVTNVPIQGYIEDVAALGVGPTYDGGEISGHLNTLRLAMNALYAILRNANILGVQSETLTPPFCSVLLASGGPESLTPSPASMVLATFKDATPSMVFSTSGPT